MEKWRDTFLVFLDVNGTPLDYVSSKNGAVLYDKENNIVGTGHARVDGVGFFNRLYTNVYRTVFETDNDADITVDFMDRMAMYKCLQEDIRLVYGAPINTGVQIFENLAVLLVLLLSSGVLWDKRKNNFFKDALCHILAAGLL